jgi:hypothetical protein
VEVKDIGFKKRINKRHLSIIVTASALALLIVAYVILTAVLPGILSGSGATPPQPPEVLPGESTYSNKATVYPYLNKNKIVSVTVGSHKDKFSMVRPADKNDQNKLLDYFIFYYEDEAGKLKEYFPPIASEDADFKYTDLYAKETSDGLGAHKIDYLLASLTALYFEDRIILSSELGEKTEIKW